MYLELNEKLLDEFIDAEALKAMSGKVADAHSRLYSDDKPKNEDFCGWVDLPQSYDKDEFKKIKEAAIKIRNDSQILLVLGIGGSYLGARAVIELLKSKNYNALVEDTPQIFYLGNSLSPDELKQIFKLCEDCDIGDKGNKGFSINVISKSGTTTEPAIAFRIFKELLEKRYGELRLHKDKNGLTDEEIDNIIKGRIFVTTDKNTKVPLKALAEAEGYTSFVVPDDIGGRYSVLSAVGLLPIAAAGINIKGLMNGAALAMKEFAETDINKNTCYRYAAIRNILYNSGKKIEIFASFETDFAMMNEWLKQLFGESEGKDYKGIYPSSVVYSTDLHSLGEYIQLGERHLFETFISFNIPREDFNMSEFLVDDKEDIDGLNYLCKAKKNISDIKNDAFKATAVAHFDGGVPVILISMPVINAENVGYMIYFFEKACAVSGYILGVNPFDQPGVEDYKDNMFMMLDRPVTRRKNMSDEEWEKEKIEYPVRKQEFQQRVAGIFG